MIFAMTETPRRRPYVSRTTAFASGAATPVQVLEECLTEIDRREAVVGAFTVIDATAARAAAAASAERWRAGTPLSAVYGMPVGVKDMIDTANMVTGMGSPLFDGYRPLFDAASVQGLRESGTVILGKTVTTEFASAHPRGTRNPWDLARTPGGSSSGSAAAVGCGMLCGGLGTQVVGSILRPSGFCAAYGFKPSVGAINRGGSLDYLSQSVTGVIAGSLADAWAMARAVADRVGGDPGYPGLIGPLTLPPSRRPARLALLRTAGWPILAAPARASLEAALERRRNSAAAGGLPRTRRGGSRDGGGAADHHGYQRLRVALAAGQLRGARCLGAQPERARAACTVASDDPGGVCGAAGPA